MAAGPGSCVAAPPGGAGTLARAPSLARHPPCVFQALRGDSPAGYLRGGSGGRRFIFTVGVCGGHLGPAFLAPPAPGPPLRRCPRLGLGPGPVRAGPLPRPAPGCPAPGKRPRKETFPSMIVLPLAERVMKILGKCYTTRGYPFGAKFPEKPGRFPGGRGATLSPGKQKRILGGPAAAET